MFRVIKASSEVNSCQKDLVSALNWFNDYFDGPDDMYDKLSVTALDYFKTDKKDPSTQRRDNRKLFDALYCMIDSARDASTVRKNLRDACEAAYEDEASEE